MAKTVIIHGNYCSFNSEMLFPKTDLQIIYKNAHCKMKRAKSTPKAKSAPISRGPIWNMLGRFGQKESKQF